MCREGVGLIDMSSFAKFLIKGEEAVAYMQKLCCNNGKPIQTNVIKLAIVIAHTTLFHFGS